MKTKVLCLTAGEVKLLVKVEKAGHGFFRVVSEFLEEFKDASEEDVLPDLSLERDEFEDLIEMVEDYLEDDGLSAEEDLPTEKEKIGLEELLLKFTGSY